MSHRDPRKSACSRRAVLRAGLAGLLGLALPWRARAFGETSQLVFAVVDHPGDPNPRPTALRRLAWEVVKRTSIEAKLESRLLSLSDPQIFYHPLLVLAGRDAFPPFDERSVASLRRHLTYGGLLFVDSAEGDLGSPFDQSVRRLLERALPGAKVEPVPRKHVLYKSFYLLDEPSGRVLRRPYLSSVVLDDRLAVVYSHNDLMGAWARDDLGMWEYDVDPRQREMAFRLGVNLVMYAMCLDYKDDQVHLPFILKRRKS
ncbi:MAG: DUF4159 domain-containing protein [Deltaproteobacteria bacterium]|nr:MAG: DUF4159 domain-containing protein [Deltaproteobacteria bacterium]